MFLLYSVQRLREIAPLHLCCPSPSLPLPMCLVPAGRILPWKVRNCFLSWLGPHCRVSQPAAAQPHCWSQEAACPIPAHHQCLLNGKAWGGGGKGSFFQNLLPIWVPIWTSYREVSMASCCFLPWPSEPGALGSPSFFTCVWLTVGSGQTQRLLVACVGGRGLVGPQASALPWRVCVPQRARCGGAHDPAASWKWFLSWGR